MGEGEVVSSLEAHPEDVGISEVSGQYEGCFGGDGVTAEVYHNMPTSHAGARISSRTFNGLIGSN